MHAEACTLPLYLLPLYLPSPPCLTQIFCVQWQVIGSHGGWDRQDWTRAMRSCICCCDAAAPQRNKADWDIFIESPPDDRGGGDGYKVG